MELKITAVGKSDPGLVRKSNQDGYAILPDHKLFLIADGMGGQKAGEVASSEALSFLSSYFKEKIASVKPAECTRDLVVSVLRDAFIQTNLHLRKLVLEKREYQGMGTTLTALHFYNDNAIVMHVGDSRAWRFREGSLQLLTKDHSVINETKAIQELIRQGRGENFNPASTLTRAVGLHPQLIPELNVFRADSKDLYLLSTDGLHGYLEARSIERILQEDGRDLAKVDKLISAVKERGAPDNVTVMLVRLEKK